MPVARERGGVDWPLGERDEWFLTAKSIRR